MITPDLAIEWYTSPDPVHDFNHIMRVYRLARYLGVLEGADLDIVLPAALLHDAGGNGPDLAAARKEHHIRSAAFAAEILKVHDYSTDQIEKIQHCIRAHRFRSVEEKPATIEAMVVFDADKLDSIGAVGVARAIAYAAISGKPFYFPPSTQFITTGELAPGEPHSAYHEYLFKLSKIKGRMFTNSGKKIAKERHQYMVAFFNKLHSEWESAESTANGE